MSLRNPLVRVVLVVQLGHYIKSKCYVLLFSLGLKNPLVHVVLVVQLGHYFKSKIPNLIFLMSLRKPLVRVVLVVQLGHYIKSKCYVLLFSGKYVLILSTDQVGRTGQCIYIFSPEIF